MWRDEGAEMKNSWLSIGTHLFFVSVSVCLFFIALLWTEILHHGTKDLLIFIATETEWETLLAGLLAAGAAIEAARRTVVKIEKQIEATQEQINIEKQHRAIIAEQDKNAAMIKLPSLASDICNYAINIFNYYLSSNITESLGAEELPHRPSIPKELLDTMSAFSRALPPDDEAHNFIRALARELQFTEVRVRENAPSKYEQFDHSNMLRACQIYARATRLFHYADSSTKEYSHEVPANFSWSLTKEVAESAIKILTPVDRKDLEKELLNKSKGIYRS